MFASLDFSHMRALDAGAMGQRFLSHALLQARGPYGLSKRFGRGT